MEVGCLKYPGASTIGSQPLDWNNAPMTGTTAQPSHEPPHQRKGTGTRDTEKTSVEEKPNKPRGRAGGEENGQQNPAGRENWTRQGITWSMYPATGHAMPKTADLGTQELLVVNSFKLHLNAFNNCIAKMEVGCLKYPGASTIGSQPLDWNNAPMTGTTAQPSHEPPHQAEGTSKPWR